MEPLVGELETTQHTGPIIGFPHRLVPGLTHVESLLLVVRALISIVCAQGVKEHWWRSFCSSRSVEHSLLLA